MIESIISTLNAIMAFSGFAMLIVIVGAMVWGSILPKEEE